MSADTHVRVPREDGWRYAINYGPEGESNYANVFAPGDEFVGNLRTHHAIAIVSALAAAPPAEEQSDGLVAELREQAKRAIVNSLEARDAMGRSADTITALTERLAAAEAEALRKDKALRDLEKAATVVSRLGAVTGPQWVKLAGALISARSALATQEADDGR